MKLQRDWQLDPQSLPFAHRIKTHALVSLVQKGLLYYQVEQEVVQVSRLAQSIHPRFSELTAWNSEHIIGGNAFLWR